MQLDLIDDRGRVLVNLERAEQAANLERVSGRIGSLVLEFCRSQVGQTFHAVELREFVERRSAGGAPGSADRILRLLRNQGRVSYTVLSRARSLYHMTGVVP